jgi:hypothetical protein
LTAATLGAGARLQTVELAIRTAMTQLGASLLGQLLAADTGHRGPRIDCGAGHHAEFVGYRDKHLDTVLGRISVRRAYYHCAACGRGIAPRDDDLGVTAASLSPGLRRMAARAAAAEPFATAADLLAELAGIRLTPKRIERSAEADGAAAAARLTAESDAIARGTVSVLAAPADRGQAPDKLYIAIDGTGVPMVPAATNGRPHPRGQARLPVHPDHRRRAGSTRPRPRLHQLPGQLRPRRAVRHPGGGRGPPPRRR